MKIFYFIVTLTIGFSAFSQNEIKEIQILNSDKTFFNEKKHPDYWRLIGNVSFKHNNTTMKCDSAYHFRKDQNMIAFGNIKIVQADSLFISGNKLNYIGKEDKIEINENVIMKNKYMILKTNQLEYNIKNKIGKYDKSGIIIDSDRIIKSKNGIYNNKNNLIKFIDSVEIIGNDYKIISNNMHYYSQLKQAYFYGPTNLFFQKDTIFTEKGWYNTKNNVAKLQKSNYIKTIDFLIKCDSLNYFKQKGYLKAINNVEIFNKKENIFINSSLAEYLVDDEKMYISKNPILKIPQKEDSLYVTGSKFFIHKNNANKELIIYDKVNIFSKEFQGKSDSLSYTINTSKINMYIEPVIWSNELQITSEHITFLLENNDIKKMYLKNNPMIISMHDSIDYNQIKGKQMTAYFEKNSITKVDVFGNGTSLYVIENDKKDKIGLNYIQSSSLSLYFKENKLNNIRYHITPNSTTIPISKITTENRYLDGFEWYEIERPKKKEDIFNPLF